MQNNEKIELFCSRNKRFKTMVKNANKKKLNVFVVVVDCYIKDAKYSGGRAFTYSNVKGAACITEWSALNRLLQKMPTKMVGFFVFHERVTDPRKKIEQVIKERHLFYKSLSV